MEYSDNTFPCECEREIYIRRYYCTVCTWEYLYGSCGICNYDYESARYIHTACDLCEGEGGSYDNYYYCSTCGYSDYNTSSHTCKCSHGQSEQHDS